MNRLIVLFVVVAVAHCQFDNFFNKFYCRRIRDSDCSLDPPDLQCGANGVTYNNRCDYTKARCSGVTTDIVHKGGCTATSGNQTMPGFNGDQAALDYLCVQLSHETCPSPVDQVCASDGKTYDNLCEYEKQKCTHRDLHVKSSGACASS